MRGTPSVTEDDEVRQHAMSTFNRAFASMHAAHRKDTTGAFHARLATAQKERVEAAHFRVKSAEKATRPRRLPMKRNLNLAALLAVAGGLAAAATPAGAFSASPCSPVSSARKNPCAANPCSAKKNPCAAKANPCAANPCSAKANPCAANPCAAKKAAAQPK
jgi:hypothetical protein